MCNQFQSPKIGSVVSNLDTNPEDGEIEVGLFQSPKIGSVVSNFTFGAYSAEGLATCFNPLKSGQLFQMQI